MKGEHLQGCAKCHLPELADATDAVAQEIVEVKLTYMPYGTPDDDAFVWREEKHTVKITPGK